MRLLESHIFQLNICVSPESFREGTVYSGESLYRIGWLCPLISLESIDHDLAQNSHFLNYAVNAVNELVQGELLQDVDSDRFGSGGSCRLSRIYGEDAAVVILCHDQLAKLADFQLADYMPAFFKLGFSAIEENCSIVRAGDAVQQYFDSTGRVIKLRPISQCLRNEVFFQDLFRGRFQLGQNLLGDFLVLYQVFEVLIDRVFECRRGEILEAIAAASNTCTKINAQIRQLQDDISEAARLRLIDTRFVNTVPPAADAVLAMKLFLGHSESDRRTDFMGLLYDVRNLVVHNFRSIVRFNELEAVNAHLRLLVCDYVRAFRQ